MIKENPVNETDCKCLNCGEVFTVNPEDSYHVYQFCCKYCYTDFSYTLV